MAKAEINSSTDKLKVGLAVAAIGASLLLVAYHFGVFEGDKLPTSAPSGVGQADTALPDETIEEARELQEEAEAEMEEEGIVESGG
ncbi:MAG: hypothetical protein H7Y88_08705 [Phycisphaerales bacterium]|nr:hypothetical protein [Phycisphaerales bacterium]